MNYLHIVIVIIISILCFHILFNYVDKENYSDINYLTCNYQIKIPKSN